MRRYGKTGGNGAGCDVGELKRRDGGKDKKGNSLFFFFQGDSFRLSFLKSQTQSAEGQ